MMSLIKHIDCKVAQRVSAYTTTVKNLVERATIISLGDIKPKKRWHSFIVSMLLVLKSFIKKRETTKSREALSDLLKGHLLFFICFFF